jgi:hypothetical protein
VSREGGPPKISVVIAAWNGPAALHACLASLVEQVAGEDVEVIVAANFTEPSLAEAFPFARLLFVGEDATVPMLRSAGMREARGEIVATVEDHMRFDAGWCREIRRAHQLAHAAIGGSVDNSAGQSIVDWAMYLLDYGAYMPPNSAGPVLALSGANISYKRAALQPLEAMLRQGLFENSLNEALLRGGHTLYLAPPAIVTHDKHYRLSEALAQCYHLARAYGAQRVAGASARRRSTYAAGSLVLPLLLPARVIARTLAKRRHVRELVLALPVLLLLELAWSLGELCGYLFGEAASDA